MARISSQIQSVDSYGNVAGSDVLAAYKVSDVAQVIGDGVSYYGFLDPDGNWYIMRRTVSAGGTIELEEFVRGTTAYATSWTGRALLTYATFSATF